MLHFHYMWIFLEEFHWNPLKSTTPGLHHWDQNLVPFHKEGPLRHLRSSNVRGLNVNNSLLAAFWSLPKTWKKTRAVWSCTASQIHSPILSQILLLLPSKAAMFSLRVKASADKLLSAQSNGPISVFMSEDINLRHFSDNTGHFSVRNFTQQPQNPELFLCLFVCLFFLSPTVYSLYENSVPGGTATLLQMSAAYPHRPFQETFQNGGCNTPASSVFSLALPSALCSQLKSNNGPEV